MHGVWLVAPVLAARRLVERDAGGDLLEKFLVAL